MSSNFKLTCLVVDDNHAVREICSSVAKLSGYRCLEAETAEQALSIMEEHHPAVLLTDLILPGMTGIDLIRQAQAMQPDLEMAIMTGHPSIDSAIEAVRLRAYDYIRKPFSIDGLKALLLRMHEKASRKAAQAALFHRPTVDAAAAGFIGSSKKVREMLRLVGRIKDLRMPVLVTGESGTGKEVVTRAIHDLSSHPERPFVVVDCGSLVPTLIESELFGHEKGAFTGASGNKQGLFQSANGGTIFLDEIGELPLEMQTKLLRVLQQKEVRPVGGNRPVKVDVRVIAATNRDLETECEKGRFRTDLFFRLNVVRVHLPSLRKRRDDIPELVHHFIRKVDPVHEIKVTAEAMGAMLNYEWPGNVRELENCVERAIALGDRRTIDLKDLPPAIQQSIPHQRPSEPSTSATNEVPEFLKAAAVQVADESENIERQTILQMLNEARGDKNLTGKLLGVSRATLYRKLRRYSIDPAEFRMAASDA